MKLSNYLCWPTHCQSSQHIAPWINDCRSVASSMSLTAVYVVETLLVNGQQNLWVRSKLMSQDFSAEHLDTCKVNSTRKNTYSFLRQPLTFSSSCLNVEHSMTSLSRIQTSLLKLTIYGVLRTNNRYILWILVSTIIIKINGVLLSSYIVFCKHNTVL